MGRLFLIVDDSASMRGLVGLTLRNAGHEVVEAVDGLDALEKLNDTRPEMMFVDVNMPRMDGLEFVKQARQLPVCRYTPIVMLTTESHTSKRQEGRIAGATGWIIKPFKPDQLLQIVTKLLG